jgi:hypothetical protein
MKLQQEQKELAEHFANYTNISNYDYLHLLQGIEIINQIDDLLSN